MAGEDQTLSVRFEADVADLRAVLTDVTKRVRGYEQAAEGSAGRSAQAHNNSARQIVAALGKIAATVVSLQTLMKLAQNTNAIKDNAEAIGVTTQQYQEWLFAAKDAGVTQDQFTVAVTRFTNQMAEARTRGGEFYSFLNQSTPTLRDQLLATQNNAQAFEVFSEAVGRMSSAEQRALLVKKAFGDEAWRMQQALAGGVTGLENSARRAQELGQVLSNETIEQTRQFSREIDKAKDSLLAMGQTAIGIAAGGFNQLSGWFTRLRKEADDLAESTGNALNGKRPKERPYISADDVRRRLQTAAGMAGKQGNLELEPRPDTRGIDALSNLQTQLASARGRQYEVIESEQRQAFDRLDKLRRQDGMSEQQYQQGRALVIATTEAKRADLARTTNDTLGDLRRSAMTANFDHYSAIRSQYEKDAADLKLSLDRQLISQTQYEEARSNLMAVTAAKVRDRMREDNEHLAQQMTGLRGAMEGNIETFMRGQTTARAFFQSLLADMSSAIQRMLILKPLMDGLFGGPKNSGGGLVGGIMSSMGFAFEPPQRAEGGPVMAGVPYLINERRGRKPEVFVPSQPGRMVPGERMSGMGGSASAPVTNNYVDARYSDTGVEDRIYAVLARMEAKRPSAASQTAAYQRRFPTRRG